jgi:hypothetical protein
MMPVATSIAIEVANIEFIPRYQNASVKMPTNPTTKSILKSVVTEIGSEVVAGGNRIM